MFRLVSSAGDIFASPLKGLIPLKYRVVLMDCPPGLGVVSVQAILNSDRVLVPTLCEPAALKGLSEAIDLIRGENQNLPKSTDRCAAESIQAPSSPHSRIGRSIN